MIFMFMHHHSIGLIREGNRVSIQFSPQYCYVVV